MFSILAKWVIARKGIVYGVVYDQYFERALHKRIVDINELGDSYGSKYLQSDLNNSFGNVLDDLNSDKLVLFSGTPCQISGLKSFLGKEYSNLICVDIICHGVASPEIWKLYIQELKQEYGTAVKSVNFRDKSTGWRECSLCVDFKNNKQYIKKHSDDPYMQLFLNNYTLRPSCYHCSFKTINRVSDFTIADFWGIEKVEPEMDDNKGISLLIIHSPKGHLILQEVEKKYVCKKVDLNSAINSNTAMLKSVVEPDNRKRYFRLVRIKGFKAGYVFFKKENLKICCRMRIKRIIRN